MEGESVVLLDKYVERSVLGVPGVLDLDIAAHGRSVQQQVNLGWQRSAGRRGSALMLFLHFQVPVPVALHLLHSSGEDAAHSGGGLDSDPPSRLVAGVGPLAGPRVSFGLYRRYEEGSRWVSVSVTVGVERLSSVPVSVSSTGFHALHHGSQGPLPSSLASKQVSNEIRKQVKQK